MLKAIPQKIIRQIFLLSIIVIIGMIIYNNMQPYLSGVLGAITLFVISRKLMHKLVKWRLSSGFSASIIIVVSFFLILLPLVGIVIMLTSKVGEAVTNSEKFLTAAKNQLSNIEQYIDYSISENIDTSSIAQFISKNAQNFALGTFDAFISISIMYFLLYFMLVKEKQFLVSLKEYIPINKNNLKVIGEEAIKKVRANAIGIPLVAIIQGVVALIGYFIFSVPDPFFWFVITAVASVIPFIGTALGIIPVTIILLSQGMTFEAIGILIYGVVVVGSSDNLIRLFILKRMADEHPLITLVGVIVGIPVFGFIGLIFGPLLVSLFLLLVKLYSKEYAEKNSYKPIPEPVQNIDEEEPNDDSEKDDIKSDSEN